MTFWCEIVTFLFQIVTGTLQQSHEAVLAGFDPWTLSLTRARRDWGGGRPCYSSILPSSWWKRSWRWVCSNLFVHFWTKTAQQTVLSFKPAWSCSSATSLLAAQKFIKSSEKWWRHRLLTSSSTTQLSLRKNVHKQKTVHKCVAARSFSCWGFLTWILLVSASSEPTAVETCHTCRTEVSC